MTKTDKFKVGDRVSVYAAELELFGSPATVQGLLPDGRLYATLDKPNQLADTPRLHSKQCRRLVKRGARTYWIEMEGDHWVKTNFNEIRETMRPGERIEFREVRK